MKTLKRILAVCLFVGSLVVLSGFASSDNNSATVIEEFGCAMYVDYLGYSVVSWGGENIMVGNNGGNVTLSCKFKNVPIPPDGKAWVNKEPHLCGTFWGVTDNTQRVVDTDGYGMLRCQIKKSK